MIAFSPVTITISFRIFIIALIITGISIICIDSKIGNICAITFWFSIITILASLGIGLQQIHYRNTTINTERTYYRYIINAYNNRDTLTPLEIDEYNRRLTELQIFQKQYPECISHNCDYSIQPFITPIAEEN